MNDLIRCETPAQVERIATANHLPFTSSSHAAAVKIGEVTYFWAAV